MAVKPDNMILIQSAQSIAKQVAKAAAASSAAQTALMDGEDVDEATKEAANNVQLVSITNNDGKKEGKD